MTVIVTGAAGFIGDRTARALLARGETVVGVDAFNDYYDPALKAARAARLHSDANFRMVCMDITDAEAFATLVHETGTRRLIHFAAQAGVRYSLDNPFAYERANLAGHLSVLEACRHVSGFEHLVYASSSSVYGDRPGSGDAFSETDTVDQPVSLYAATKRSGELMSIAYTKLFGIPQTGLRFFTVYGPWGRPDMAYFSFARSILSGQPIEVFGHGKMARDFTYIDDIVEGVLRVLECPPLRGEHQLFNIGGGRPVELMDMIGVLEQALGREAKKVFKPFQPGDVTRTYANVAKLQELTGYCPAVPIEEGLPQFVQWFKSYYG